MKLLSILIFSALLIGCGNSKNTSAPAAEKPQETGPTAKAAILSQDIGKFRNTQPYSILNINLEGNVLQLDITYNGGCKEHEFELVGSAFIMKSSPPKRIIQLYHHNSNDDCRELINESLYFDISSFAYNDKEIVLQLQHYKDSFRYTKIVE